MNAVWPPSICVSSRTGVVLGARFYTGEIGGLLGENVVRCDREQRVGAILQLHGVGALAVKIDGHLIDQEIDCRDLSEAPALM